MMRPTPPGARGPPGGRQHQQQQLNSRPTAPPGSAPTYWQAVEDTHIFAGPLGELVGEVDAGSVVREMTRLQDEFGGWWIGTRASADGHGGADSVANAPSPEPSSPSLKLTRALPGLVWISYNDSQIRPLEALAEAPPTWAQVFIQEDSPPARGAAPTRALSAALLTTRGRTPPSPSPSSPVGNMRKASVNSAESDPSRLQEEKPIPALDMQRALADARKQATLEALGDFHHGRIPGMPADIDLIHHYWASRTEDRAPTGDWNQRYQELVEDALFHTSGVDLESLRRASHRLHKLLEEFATTCQRIAVAVVEMLLGGSLKRLPSDQNRPLVPHPDHSTTVFYSDGLLVRLCCDTADGYFGGEGNAQKFALRRFQGLRLLSTVAPRCLLSYPLAGLADFEGHRVLVRSIPPIPPGVAPAYSPLRWLQGNQAAANLAPAEIPVLIKRLLRDAASTLNCAPLELTGSANPPLSGLPVEAEVFVGRDRRLYLFNSERLRLPFCAPAPLEPENAAGVALSPVVQLTLSCLRPELLLAFPEPVNVNTGIAGCTASDDVLRVWALRDHLKSDAITSCAASLGMMAPVRIPMPAVDCTTCKQHISPEELRFVVCRSPQRCCRICVQCYTRFVAPATGEEQETSEQTDAAAVLREAVTCWQSNDGARLLRGLLMEPGVTDLVHANGLSMRHLAYVYHRLPTASRPFVGHYLEVEMIARAAASLLRTTLRGAAAADDAKRTIESFFIALMQSSGPQSERLWSKDLGPLVEKMFHGIAEPFSTSDVCKELLAERIQELTGVVFTRGSLASLDRETSGSGSPTKIVGRAFLLLQAVNPRVKTVLPPAVHLEDARAAEARATRDVERLTESLEGVLLFWIGYSPDGVLESLQPKYLEGVFAGAVSS